MNGRRIAAVALKEWREITRDRVFFALAFLLPVVWMMVFGYALTVDVQNIPCAIVDDDRSAMSRDFAHRFIDSRYFDFKGQLASEHAADRLLADGAVRLVIVIPQHFQRNLMAGRQVTVQTLHDGTFANRAQTVLGYVDAITRSASGEVQVQYLSRQLGMSAESALTLLQPVRLELRYLYNQALRSIWSIAPSLMMYTLMLSAPLLTALSVVREKETGSIYNIYASTVTRAELLAGKLLPNVGISMFNAVVLWMLAHLYFGAPFKGSLGFFFVATLSYVLCASSMGLLISVASRTQVAALMIAIILAVIPAIQFSGMFVPVAFLTGSAAVQAHLFPPMYFENIALGAFLKGVGWSVLWPDVAALVLYSAVMLAVSYALFRKRVPR
jgi:ABC-2 type transport system permease protein